MVTKISSENESVIKLKIKFTPPDSQVLNLSIFILEQLQQHFDNLPLTVIVQLDGVLLQLRHQVIGSHEPEVLVSGRHLNQTKFKHFFTFMEFLWQWLTFSKRWAIPVIMRPGCGFWENRNDNYLSICKSIYLQWLQKNIYWVDCSVSDFWYLTQMRKKCVLSMRSSRQYEAAQCATWKHGGPSEKL